MSAFRSWCKRSSLVSSLRCHSVLACKIHFSVHAGLYSNLHGSIEVNRHGLCTDAATKTPNMEYLKWSFDASVSTTCPKNFERASFATHYQPRATLLYSLLLAAQHTRLTYQISSFHTPIVFTDTVDRATRLLRPTISSEAYAGIRCGRKAPIRH